MRVSFGSAALTGVVAACALALTGCGGPAMSTEPTITSPATTGPTDTAEPTEPVNPTQSTDPTQTTDPTESTDPTETTDPGDDPDDDPDDDAATIVKPQITLAAVEGDQVHVAATIKGVNRADGTCTLEARRGGQTATVSQPAVYNVNRTECGGLYIKVKKLGSGQWTLAVTYRADGVAGTGEPVTLEVG